jgi:1-acyl-sn-glycerol-3-phosphate acyltransferase
MRLTLRAAAMVAGLLVCLPLHYLWRLIGLRSPWPRRWLTWVGWSAGLRVRVRGRPLASHVLFVSNHLSWLDIMAVAGPTGAAFVSRGDVANWPLAGWLATLNDTIFVERAERKAVRGQADTLRSALASGRPVAMFPEATTEGGEEVLPFRASLFASLLPPLPGVRLQPVAIDYGRAAPDIAWIGDEPAGSNAKRVLSRAGTIAITLSFLEPIDPARVQDRKALAQLARQEIVDALGASASGADRL